MAALSQTKFLKTLPELVVARLPESLQEIKARQSNRWLTQFHFGEPWLHFEVSSAQYRPGWDLGFRCESKDHDMNWFLLFGFCRHLFKIKE